MAAFFIDNSDGSMPYLKLMKLLYLSDRLALKELGYFLSDDKHCSMKLGPVLSDTYDLISKSNFANKANQSKWNDYLEVVNYDIQLKKQVDFDYLSKADLKILESIWNRFKDVDKYDLADFTHKFCPEWTDPGNSSTPIPLEEILCALGYEGISKDNMIIHLQDLKATSNLFA